jgi:hypothetical protein
MLVAPVMGLSSLLLLLQPTVASASKPPPTNIDQPAHPLVRLVLI